MSKLSFRARALDASKPMPIYLSEELPDLPEYLSINRAVPQMPSGMEKEEESERHLQEAITTGKVIPTPEVFNLELLGEGERYDRLYPANHKVPKQYTHYQSYAFDNDVPEYDLDSEDEKWINAQVKKMDVPLTYDQFEEMMDRLEKGSGQQVITLKEAKLLLKEDDDLIVAVYDYWLNKRLRLQYPLIPAVKTEKTAGVAHTNNPYIAFRRRLEKMQTRKNRKNDEASYEKMLKLRRDLSRAVTILEMVKRREKMKKEHLHLTVEIFEKRYSIGDYSGQVLTDVSSHKAASSSAAASAAAAAAAAAAASTSAAPPPPVTSRPAYSPLYLNQHQWATKVKIRTAQDDHAQKEKRSYKKRKHSRPHILPAARPSTSGAFPHGSDVVIDTVTSDEDEQASLPAPQPLPPPPPPPPPPFSEEEEDPEPDGEFTFRRKRHCSYLAPSVWSRLEAVVDGRLAADPAAGRPHLRYSVGSLSRPKRRCLGRVRHRVGRGGRVIIDRAFSSDDDYWRSLDFKVLTPESGPHFHPVERPSPCPSPEMDVEDYIQNLPSGYRIEGTPSDAAADAAVPSAGGPLTVHMVPSSSVRLVPTPEAAPAAQAPPAEPPPPPQPASSVFALTPSDTFSELVTNLISPYLVDSDGVLLTSAELGGSDAAGDSDGDAAAEPGAGGPPAAAPAPAADGTPPERGGRPGPSSGGGGGAWPAPATSAASGLVTLLAGGGTTTAAGSHVLLADTPPTLEPLPDKADNSHSHSLSGSDAHARDGKPPPPATTHLVKKLVRKGSGPMEVT